jgi:hypothetical protein
LQLIPTLHQDVLLCGTELKPARIFSDHGTMNFIAQYAYVKNLPSARKGQASSAFSKVAFLNSGYMKTCLHSDSFVYRLIALVPPKLL